MKEEVKDGGSQMQYLHWAHELPSHWEVRRLKYLAAVSFSTVDKHSLPDEVLVQLCNYTDVYYNDRIAGDMAFMRATCSVEELRRFRLREGDVLVTKDSESWDDIAVPAYVSADLDNVVCGYHLALIRPKRGVSGRYLSWCFMGRGINDQFRIEATGITRYGLGRASLADGLFPLPPYPEQIATADFLDRETAKIDELVAKKERLIELLEEKRGSLINQAVTRGLNPSAPLKDSGVEWLGEVPADWENWKISHAFGRIGSGTTPRSDDADYYGGDVPWVTTAELRETEIVETGSSVSELALRNHSVLQLYPPGTLLIAMYGATIGRLGILRISACVNQACCALSEPRALDVRFTYYWLWARRQEIIADASGGGQLNIGQDKVRGLHVPAPALAEQRAIAAFLDRETTRLDALISKIRGAIEKLREYRSALVSAAVTGKIDIREGASVS